MALAAAWARTRSGRNSTKPSSIKRGLLLRPQHPHRYGGPRRQSEARPRIGAVISHLLEVPAPPLTVRSALPPEMRSRLATSFAQMIGSRFDERQTPVPRARFVVGHCGPPRRCRRTGQICPAVVARQLTATGEGGHPARRDVRVLAEEERVEQPRLLRAPGESAWIHRLVGADTAQPELHLRPPTSRPRAVWWQVALPSAMGLELGPLDIEGWTRRRKAPWAKPQSVPPIDVFWADQTR